MLVNYTIDAPSPILQYVGSWRRILPDNDDEYEDYNNHTAIATWVAGDSVTLQFYGTGVWLHGAKRGNHGQYNVTLDGATTTTDGSAVPDQFEALLYGASNLSRGNHTIRLTNAPNNTNNTWVDVDYIILQDSDQGTPSSSTTTTPTIFADNSDQGFAYYPSSSDWTIESDNNSFGNSIRRTQSPAGSAKFTFMGESVALYGRLGPLDGAYMCGIDHSVNTTHTGTSSQTANQQILCFANGLDKETEHTLRIWNQPNGDNKWLEIDFAQVWGDDAETVPATHHTPKMALIAGITGFIALILLITASLTILFFARRRKKRNQDRRTSYAQVRLDEGEDWTLEPFPSGTVTSPPAHYPGDTLGVYSGLSSAASGNSSHGHERDSSQSSAGIPFSPTSPNPTISPAVRHETVDTTAGTIGSGTSTRRQSFATSPFDDSYGVSAGANGEHRYGGSTSGTGARIRREEDAGLLMTDQDDDIPILPPEYSQASSNYRPPIAPDHGYRDRKR